MMKSELWLTIESSSFTARFKAKLQTSEYTIVKILPNINKKNVTAGQREKRIDEEKRKIKVRQTLDFSRVLCRNPIIRDNRKINKIIKTKKSPRILCLKVDIQIKRQTF